MKRILVLLLKIGIPIAILAWLVTAATRHESFSALWSGPKNWPLLVLATGSCATATLITFVRWCYLVRALELPLRMKDALRISFVSYLFNLAPTGVLGGDLLKAWMLAREQRGREGYREKAVASVVLDRVIGLYTLFAVASVAILLTGFWQHDLRDLRYASQITLWVTGLGAVVIAVLFVPALTNQRVSQSLAKLRHVGPALEQLIGAAAMYRRKPGVLVASSVMSFGVHTCFTLGMFLLAIGLYPTTLPQDLTLGVHFVIAPLSAATGVIPLCMGPMETVYSFLYAVVSGLKSAQAQGLVVTLGYRIITVLIAAIGFGYYLTSRQEVTEVLHEARQEHPDVAPSLLELAQDGPAELHGLPRRDELSDRSRLLQS